MRHAPPGSAAKRLFAESPRRPPERTAVFFYIHPAEYPNPLTGFPCYAFCMSPQEKAKIEFRSTLIVSGTYLILAALMIPIFQTLGFYVALGNGTAPDSWVRILRAVLASGWMFALVALAAPILHKALSKRAASYALIAPWIVALAAVLLPL